MIPHANTKFAVFLIVAAQFFGAFVWFMILGQYEDATKVLLAEGTVAGLYYGARMGHQWAVSYNETHRRPTPQPESAVRPDPPPGGY